MNSPASCATGDDRVLFWSLALMAHWIGRSVATREQVIGHRTLAPVAHRASSDELWRLIGRSAPCRNAFGILMTILGRQIAAAVITAPLVFSD